MNMTPLSSAEPRITEVRQLLTSKTHLYSSYVHLVRREQTMSHEYCNVSDGTQKVTIVLLSLDGQMPEGMVPRAQLMEPNEILSIDTDPWVRAAQKGSFVGQILFLIEQVTSQGAPHILPAITAHWMSPDHHCEIATDAFDRVNLRSFNRKKSFYMYCPMAKSDARRTTLITLFNHSTDNGYEDSADIETALFGTDGERLEGPRAIIPPFGALALDVTAHFGEPGEAFFRKNNGHASLTLRHLGHTLPAYFFHLDRQTRDVLSGQHAQPPVSALTRPGIWWGKLRRFGV